VSGQNACCRIIESNFPDDYHLVSQTNCQQTVIHGSGTGTCTLTNGPDRATFIIHKEWDQLGDTDGIPVTGHLSCTGATTTQQNVVFAATTDALLFGYNINDAQGPVDCTVWEDVPDNYRATYDCEDPSCGDSGQDLDHCFFGDVDFFGVYQCNITNRPLPANVTVTKTWVIKDTFDNVIESDNGCGNMRIRAGDDIDCEIVNTVFFEGIPTPKQQGMALLALLMTGVGLVGFPRFF